MQLNIAKHFGTIHDTRVITDPWGIGLQVEILRAGHPDWQKWLADNYTDGLASGMLKEVVRLQMERRAKAGSADEEKMLDAAAARVVASSRERDEKAKNFDKLKDGIADILIRSVPSGLSSPTGETIQFSREAARALVANPTDEATGLLIWVPETRPGKDGKPEPMPFGGQPVGDAIATWLMDEAAKSEAFYSRYLEAASGN